MLFKKWVLIVTLIVIFALWMSLFAEEIRTPAQEARSLRLHDNPSLTLNLREAETVEYRGIKALRVKMGSGFPDKFDRIGFTPIGIPAEWPPPSP